MTRFETMAATMTAFDWSRALSTLFSRQDYRRFIVVLNQERLYNEGTDAEGKQIRTFRAEAGEVYNRFTINVKSQKGQPDDRVTLKDTGEFYKTFQIEVDEDGFTITADDNKPEGKISDNVDVDAALGLTDDDLEFVKEKLIVDLRKLVIESILNSE